jgi:transcriptional/translational regulatory protein YebC/TACO1
MIPAADGVTEEKVMEVVLTAGADDMESEADGFTVTCSPAAFSDVCAALEAAEIVFDQENSQVGLVAQTLVPVKELSVVKAVNKFVDALEENDDVQDVFTNMDIDDALVEQLEAEQAAE